MSLLVHVMPAWGAAVYVQEVGCGGGGGGGGGGGDGIQCVRLSIQYCGMVRAWVSLFGIIIIDLQALIQVRITAST